MTRDLFDSLDGFDVLYSPFDGECLDFCYRAWKQKRCCYDHSAFQCRPFSESLFRSSFSSDALTQIKLKNQYLFVWKNISTVSGALEKLSKLNPVNYNWRQDEFQNKGFNDKKQWGFIAQEVEKVMPELVGADEEDYLTLNYNGFVPLLTKAMQEQQTEIENQQKEIDELKAQLEMIMKMMQSDMSDKTDNKKAENNEKPVKLSMTTVK